MSVCGNSGIASVARTVFASARARARAGGSAMTASSAKEEGGRGVDDTLDTLIRQTEVRTAKGTPALAISAFSQTFFAL